MIAYLREIALTVGMYALVAIAGALWKKELVRLGRWIAKQAKRGWAFLRAKWTALKSEGRLFVAWVRAFVFQPDPQREGPGPRRWVELDISSPEVKPFAAWPLWEDARPEPAPTPKRPKRKRRPTK